jgi:D-beta-D-heptose 7-phosphate kinase/D-beta-D-heptose 1-phosphate adenosyltransferase
MNKTCPKTLPLKRVHELLAAAQKCRLVVVGDLMLDQFVWGRVSRISPEAPVPVVEFDRESFMPGGAANAARNLTCLGAKTQLLGVVGPDETAAKLKALLEECRVDCNGFVTDAQRATSIKTRIIAQQQQVVRVDRETHAELAPATNQALLQALEARLEGADAMIVGDYAKGVVTQWLLDELKPRCRARGVWLSLDPKPLHHLNLAGMSLVTPNRKEAFALAQLPDSFRAREPLADAALQEVAQKLMTELKPAVLLITLGEQGMLLCQRGQPPFHIPTVAREVFDVSGAGDTVIASFTLAIAAGASPVEAAIFSNHAGGVVVGKLGTATVSPEELLASFRRAE